MKIVTLEEHIVTPDVLEAWSRLPTAREDGLGFNGEGELGRRLADVDERRLCEMDEMGIDVQVLSLTTPGVQNLAPEDAVALARVTNDAIAGAVSAHPDRFEGFATLPTPNPSAAAEELRRAVQELGLKGAMLCGRTGARNMDDPGLDELYATAGALRAPLYIHPQQPTRPVREAYYSDLGDAVDRLFAGYGLGWHYETGIQLLRLIFSGTFDRHPDLQVITGHWGEVVLFYLERIAVLDGALSLERPLAEYLRHNVSYTGSGILSPRYLRWTIEIVGAERILYAVDYPYLIPDGQDARAFLEHADLPQGDRERIAHRNWDRLTAR